MDKRAQITIRTKKLGVLIRDVRLANRKGIEECADAIGVSKGVFRAYEQGRRAPSLPELEFLALFLDREIDHFWGKDALSNTAAPTGPLNITRLVGLRQRMIGALLRQARINANISLKELADQVSFPLARIRAYELGERPIPLPELEEMITVLGGRIENFFDKSGPIGQWMSQQQSIRDFIQLPSELQSFVCQPVNRPYLELASNLSKLPAEKLRSVAESLLDITL